MMCSCCRRGGARTPWCSARSAPSARAAGTIGNVIWFVLAGWWLAIGHLVTAVGLALTIIGLPFAWAHLKLAGIALWPVGKAVVPADQPEVGPVAYPVRR